MTWHKIEYYKHMDNTLPPQCIGVAYIDELRVMSAQNYSPWEEFALLNIGGATFLVTEDTMNRVMSSICPEVCKNE